MEESVGIYARHFPYLDRFVRVELRDDSLVALSFPEDVPDDIDADHDLLDRIEDYLTGVVRETFEDVDVDIELTAPERAILEAVREIPYGESTTVENLVRAVSEFDIEDTNAETRIRETLVANPIPLVIPDHRVRDGPSSAPPTVEQRLRSLEHVGG